MLIRKFLSLKLSVIACLATANFCSCAQRQMTPFNTMVASSQFKYAPSAVLGTIGAVGLLSQNMSKANWYKIGSSGALLAASSAWATYVQSLQYEQSLQRLTDQENNQNCENTINRPHNSWQYVLPPVITAALVTSIGAYHKNLMRGLLGGIIIAAFPAWYARSYIDALLKSQNASKKKSDNIIPIEVAPNLLLASQTINNTDTNKDALLTLKDPSKNDATLILQDASKKEWDYIIPRETSVSPLLVASQTINNLAPEQKKQYINKIKTELTVKQYDNLLTLAIRLKDTSIKENNDNLLKLLKTIREHNTMVFESQDQAHKSLKDSINNKIFTSRFDEQNNSYYENIEDALFYLSNNINIPTIISDLYDTYPEQTFNVFRELKKRKKLDEQANMGFAPQYSKIEVAAWGAYQGHLVS